MNRQIKKLVALRKRRVRDQRILEQTLGNRLNELHKNWEQLKTKIKKATT